MNSTDYILEAAGVSDVDIMDIEVAQAFAEMAVLEAMMNCYDKQIVLLEYNEDSADEIFTESETHMPGMADWMLEAGFAEHLQNQKRRRKGFEQFKEDSNRVVALTLPGKKDIIVGEALNGKLAINEGNGLQYFNSENELWDTLTKNYYEYLEAPRNSLFGSLQKKLEAWRKTRKKMQPSSSEQAQDLMDQVNGPVGGYGASEIEQGSGKPKSVVAGSNKSGAKGAGGGNKTAGGAKGAGGSYQPGTNTLMGNMNLDPHGDNPDPRQQQLASDIPTASKKLAFKKFMNKCWSVCVKLVTSIVDAIFAIDFPRLKKTLEAKGAEEIVLNDKELTTLKKMEDLVDIGEQYEQKFGLEFLKANRWSKQATDNAVVGLRMLDKALKEYKVQTPINNDEKNETRVTAKHLAELCDKLGRNDLKKKIRKWGQDVAKHNTDFNAENGIPNQLADELRNFNKTLMKAYSETAKSFQKLLNWCIEIGVAQDNREKHGGVDADLHAPKEIKAEAREGAKKYREENPSKIQQAFNKLGGNKAAAWAEEGWSMDLSEDEDFF